MSACKAHNGVYNIGKYYLEVNQFYYEVWRKVREHMMYSFLLKLVLRYVENK